MLRTDYLETGRRPGDRFEEFPASPTAPIIVFGVALQGSEVISAAANSLTDARTAGADLQAKCVPGSIRAVGVWPGKVNSDVFFLNAEYYAGVKVEPPKKPKSPKKPKKGKR